MEEGIILSNEDSNLEKEWGMNLVMEINIKTGYRGSKLVLGEWITKNARLLMKLLNPSGH